MKISNRMTVLQRCVLCCFHMNRFLALTCFSSFASKQLLAGELQVSKHWPTAVFLRPEGCFWFRLGWCLIIQNSLVWVNRDVWSSREGVEPHGLEQTKVMLTCCRLMLAEFSCVNFVRVLSIEWHRYWSDFNITNWYMRVAQGTDSVFGVR